MATRQQDVCSASELHLSDLRLAICALNSAHRGWVGFISNPFSNPASRSAQRLRLFAVHRSRVTFCGLAAHTSETSNTPPIFETAGPAVHAASCSRAYCGSEREMNTKPDCITEISGSLARTSRWREGMKTPNDAHNDRLDFGLVGVRPVISAASSDRR